jgi:hypothetical protein
MYGFGGGYGYGKKPKKFLTQENVSAEGDEKKNSGEDFGAIVLYTVHIACNVMRENLSHIFSCAFGSDVLINVLHFIQPALGRQYSN